MEPVETLAVQIEIRWWRLVFGIAILVIGFGAPICQLVQFAAHSELYSQILLVPFITAYLIWLKRNALPSGAQPAARTAVTFIGAGLALLAAFWFARPVGSLHTEDYLAWVLSAFLLLLVGVCCSVLSAATMRALAFPLGLLIFIVPIPTILMDWITSFLQNGSATMAYGMFVLSGMPVAKDGLIFHLPGMNLEVAPECSGIHSTLSLLITSLLAGYLFLRSPWKRALLSLAVVPLALLRNGFRVFTIGQLCVRIGPEMIHSYIHRRGGPIFFALSLLPLFLFLILLRKSERRLDQGL
jgi:exosortase C (VPDSG-CTERM-specific)